MGKPRYYVQLWESLANGMWGVMDRSSSKYAEEHVPACVSSSRRRARRIARLLNEDERRRYIGRSLASARAALAGNASTEVEALIREITPKIEVSDGGVKGKPTTAEVLEALRKRFLYHIAAVRSGWVGGGRPPRDSASDGLLRAYRVGLRDVVAAIADAGVDDDGERECFVRKGATLGVPQDCEGDGHFTCPDCARRAEVST